MSENSMKSEGGAATAILRQPVLWGGLATALFYIAVGAGYLQHPIVTRYFASHPVEYIATTMFFVGMAALVLKYLRVSSRSSMPQESILGPQTEQPLDASGATFLIDTLNQKDRSVRSSLLGRRLHAILGYIERKRSAADYEEQLHYLADAAETESQRGYSLVRIISSTIPILGFLGTVIGLTKAVAELATQVGEVGLEEAINSVVSGLSVAFDTTATSLALSIVLMFAMHFVSRRESKLLTDVENRAQDEMVGRFFIDPMANDPQLLAVRRMCEQVLQATDGLVRRQSELWEATIDAAHQRWSTLSVTTEKQLETALGRALQTSYETHAKQLEASADATAKRNSEQWDRAVAVLQESVQQMQAQHGELQRQGDVMLQAVDATGRVLKLEDALNKNLGSLAESHNFEQVVMSLAAALNLFSAKVGQAPNVGGGIDNLPHTGQAA